MPYGLDKGQAERATDAETKISKRLEETAVEKRALGGGSQEVRASELVELLVATLKPKVILAN